MIGPQFATRSEVEALRRKLQQAISGAGVVQHGSDTDMAENFIELADVPQSYAGCAGEIVAVNAAADELHFNPYITVGETEPTLTIRNMTDSSVDPIIQFALGATPSVLYTMGIDDSNDDWWMLCKNNELGCPRFIAANYSSEILVLNSWADPPDQMHGQNIRLIRTNLRLYAHYVDSEIYGEIFIEAGGYVDWPGTIRLSAEIILIDDRAELRFLERGDDATEYVGFKAPAVIASSLIWTLPSADSSGTQALVSDGSGHLSWASIVSTAALDDLTDVVITSPATGDILRYDGSNWVNYAGNEYRYYADLADDAIFTLPFSITSSARGFIAIGDNEERTDFWIDNDGDVVLINNSTNVVANADTDNKFCIGTAAAQEPLQIKNRLGSTKKIFLTAWYN